jgi:putative salt-induced outer membrane protein YdiY
MTRPGRASPFLKPAVRGALVVALLWPPSIAASGTASDVLVGPNGERIPGTLVSERDGWIEFDSILLGRLRVEADRVRVERKSTGSVEPRVATAAARSVGPNDLNREVGDATPTAAPAAAAPLLPGGAAPAPILARIGWVPDGWTQSAGLSARVLGGSREDDKVESTVEYKAQRGQGANVSSFDVRYSREREEGVVSENDWRVSLRHEYEFGDRRFSVGSFTHRGDLDDDERKLSRSFAAGSGWRLVETERVNLRLAPGYAFVRVRDARGPGSGDGPAAYLRVAWRPFGSFELSGTTMVAASRKALGRNFVDANARIDWPLTEHLGFAVRWDYTRNEFDFDTGDASNLHFLLTWSP